MRNRILALMGFCGAVLINAQNASGNVGINTETPRATLDVQPRAADLSSTVNKGLLVPRLTQAEISALAVPVPGQMVYNTSDNCLMHYGATVHSSNAAPVFEWRCSTAGGQLFDAPKTLHEGLFIFSADNTADGGYVISAIVEGANGLADILVKKFNKFGIEGWQKQLGGSSYELMQIKHTKDNGYILFGHTDSDDGDISDSKYGNDAWVVKLDANGNIEWSKTFGGMSHDTFEDLAETADGGYIAVGWTWSEDLPGYHDSQEAWFVKIDATGNIEWQKLIGGNHRDTLASVVETADGYIAVGSTRSNDGDLTDYPPANGGSRTEGDALMVKLSLAGELEWIKIFGTDGSEEFLQILINHDSNLIVTGPYWRTKEGDDPNGYFYRILELDLSTNILSQRLIGGVHQPYLNKIIQTPDNGYIIIGETSFGGEFASDDGSRDALMIKLDEQLNRSWHKSFGGSGNEQLNVILSRPNNQYLGFGLTESIDGIFSGNTAPFASFIVRIDANGNIIK